MKTGEDRVETGWRAQVPLPDPACLMARRSGQTMGGIGA